MVSAGQLRKTKVWSQVIVGGGMSLAAGVCRANPSYYDKGFLARSQGCKPYPSQFAIYGVPEVKEFHPKLEIQKRGV